MAQKSKRIILFSTAFHPLIGGSEIALENIIRHLPNVFFDLLTPRYSRQVAKWEMVGNLRIYRLGLGCRWDKYLFPILGLWQYWRLTRHQPNSVIHAFQASQAAGAAYLVKHLRPRTRFILTLQEGQALVRQSWFVKFFRALIIYRADQITAISQYLADYARMLNWHSPVIIIPNGVDIKRFIQVRQESVDEQKRQLGIKGSDRVIITVSRLVEKNSLTDLIAALAELRTSQPDVKLLIIGDGPLRAVLAKQAKSLKLENSILWLGEIPNQLLPTYLKMGDVFIRPSRSEGQGIAFLEAMAAGLPIIGTPVGGIPDFLHDHETGLFCQVNNPNDLAEKIHLLLTDGELKRRITVAAIQLVSQTYQWADIAKHYSQLYAN